MGLGLRGRRVFPLGERLDIAGRQADFSFHRIDLDHARANRIADLERLVELRFRIALNFRDVGQTFDAFRKPDEQAKVGDLRDRSDDRFTNVVGLLEVVPLVRKKFLARK